MFGNLKRITLVVDRKSLVISLLAIGSMLLCRQFEIEADFPLTLISTAIVFPIVFSIGGAYKRRENALAEYGNIKAHGRAIYFAVRDWMPEENEESLKRTREVLGELMVSMRTLFTGSVEAMDGNERAVYAAYSRLSRLI